jgi:hypothetical protein
VPGVRSVSDEVNEPVVPEDVIVVLSVVGVDAVL